MYLQISIPDTTGKGITFTTNPTSLLDLSLYDVPLTETSLGRRITLALTNRFRHYHKVVTIRNILGTTKKELERINNIGPKGIEKIEACLKEYGISI